MRAATHAGNSEGKGSGLLSSGPAVHKQRRWGVERGNGAQDHAADVEREGRRIPTWSARTEPSRQRQP
jgi:hypothetical protein